MKARLVITGTPDKAEVLSNGTVVIEIEEDINCLDEGEAVNDPEGYKIDMVKNHFELLFEVIPDEEEEDV